MPDKPKTKSKLPLIFIIVGLIIVVGLILLSKFSSKSSVSDASISPPDASGLLTYKSEKYGYSVKHPQGWTVDDSNFAKNQEIIISENSQNAFVKINAYQDSSINSEKTVRQASERFIQEMKSDPNVTITASQADFKDAAGGHIITGQQVIAGQDYEFQNRALIFTNGRMLFFHATVKKEAANPDYASKINAIMESFKTE